MTVLYFVLLLLALICFVLTGINRPVSRVDLLSLGLAFWVAVPFLQLLQKL